MKSLNVVGAGRVGRTLASLWEETHTFAVQDVLDRTLTAARAGVAFIGAGTPVASLAALRAADVWMITTSDREIAQSCMQLANGGVLRAGDVVFHCSGSMPSTDLAAASAHGCHIASVHPLKSFADPRDAARTFNGSYCAIEGEAAALDVLKPAFERIGGRLSEIDARFKTVYHAASVVVSNYLAALMETGLRCYEKAGLPRETAIVMMEPIVRGTLENIFEFGTAKALTGPISRGDDQVVARHLQALSAWDSRVTDVYRDLGLVAVELARVQSEAETEALARIEALLSRR